MIPRYTIDHFKEGNTISSYEGTPHQIISISLPTNINKGTTTLKNLKSGNIFTLTWNNLDACWQEVKV